VYYEKFVDLVEYNIPNQAHCVRCPALELLCDWVIWPSDEKVWRPLAQTHMKRTSKGTTKVYGTTVNWTTIYRNETWFNLGKTLLRRGPHPAFYICNHNALFNLFQVQSPFSPFFIIDWELAWVRTLRTRDQNSSEASSCEWL